MVTFDVHAYSHDLVHRRGGLAVAEFGMYVAKLRETAFRSCRVDNDTEKTNCKLDKALVTVKVGACLLIFKSTPHSDNVQLLALCERVRNDSPNAEAVSKPHAKTQLYAPLSCKPVVRTKEPCSHPKTDLGNGDTQYMPPRNLSLPPFHIPA